MSELLYHPEVYLPKHGPLPRMVRARYSKHALRAANNDRYGSIPTPHIINLSEFSLVELGMTDGKPTKYVMRGPLDNERDVVYVLRTYRNHTRITQYMVVTVWCNLKSDKHRTLDRSRYATA